MAKNNYDQWRIDWQQRFLSMDLQHLRKKLPFLLLEEDRLLVPYFEQMVPIRLGDGVIEKPHAWQSLSLMDEMNIYTMLWYSKKDASLTGDWVAFEDLKDARPFGPAFRKGNLAPFAATFEGHPNQLRQALIALGGRPLEIGEVGYEISVFPCIPMRVLFWDGDDEFPAQVNLLFDRSATDFNHVESIVSIASEALRHLANEAGLPLGGAAF